MFSESGWFRWRPSLGILNLQIQKQNVIPIVIEPVKQYYVIFVQGFMGRSSKSTMGCIRNFKENLDYFQRSFLSLILRLML